VLERDGHRCVAIEDGKRCLVVIGLVAQHLVPLAHPDAYEATAGVTLCTAHHREVDPHAR
jgi:hypothetical protein